MYVKKILAEILRVVAPLTTFSIAMWFVQLGCHTYSVKAGRRGKPLPVILCDTMGLEEGTWVGLDVDDVISILKGHLPDRYQVNT